MDTHFASAERKLARSSRRISREVELQRWLMEDYTHTFKPYLEPIQAKSIIEELRDVFDSHPFRPIPGSWVF